MLWLICLSVFMSAVCFFLLIKTIMLRKSADEIRDQIRSIPSDDTNILITISGHDRHIKMLAAELNTQLRFLRDERHKYINGDNELKEAVTNISHDLRTPLTAICGYLDLLKNEKKSETVDSYISVIENRTEVLRQLTEELFRYSVLASVSDELSCEDVDIGRVIEESISGFYAALKGAGITPQISIADRKIIRKLDAGSLIRIFSNIISNAIKYSDGDLNIVLSDDGEIIFSNSAPELSETQVGRLFNRFYTVENARNSTGLGLSIAKLLTEHMGGTIRAEYKNRQLIIRLTF
ncbi:MAG: HAMP domain-containing sensor histidine kinase [Oscillospiraceae bacterium]|nr:HAMP domain-containing sensor histidine kinase [Oscillospiraceae bacterium]